jgi:hypothetical protein
MPIAVLILWYSTRWGITGVAASQIVIGLISVSLDMLVANHVMNYPISELFKAISPALLSTVIMAAVLFMIREILPVAGLAQLLLMVLLGGLTYIAVFWSTSRETLIQGFTTVRSILTRKKASSKTILEAASND